MRDNLKDLEFDKFRPADNNKSKVATTIEQDPDSPVPVYQTYGNSYPLYGESSTSPGSEVELINDNVSASSIRVLDVNLSCHIEGKVIVKIDGVAVATGRTAPGRPDVKIIFNPFREVLQNENLSVVFKARPGSIVSEVEAYINAASI
jgi:hypothetical protein